jgi:restriction system protein
MSWQDFELLIGEHFRSEGYSVSETTGGADGGVDLVLKKDGARYLVQCKQWKAYKVGVKVVRELLGVMVGKGASGGFVVTSGEFTSDAIRFADENNIQLIEGGKLKSIISNTPTISKIPLPLKDPQPQAAPLCPKCGCTMLKRVSTKGNRAGQSFWGCSKFPNCRGTLSMNQQ